MMAKKSSDEKPTNPEPEPAIVGFGRQFVGKYPEQEYIDSLTRAFKDGRSDYIMLDSIWRGQEFLAAGVAWALDRDWLYNDRNWDEGQCLISSFRLTAAGKKAILG